MQLFSLVMAARAERKAAGANCFVAGTQVETAYGPVAIEQFQAGQRVDTVLDGATSAGSPPAALGDPNATAVDPASWRLVTLRMADPKEAGNDYEMQLLEPVSWINQEHAVAGGWVDLSLPELQISGRAQVVSVGACPPIETGRGRVVLGTFTHVSHDLVAVTLRGEVKPLEVTAGHKLWSMDRGEWVQAGSLHSGERLATEHGTAIVQSVVAENGERRVYNLDVEADHRYFVSDLGVLGHNADPCTPVNKAVNSNIQHAGDQTLARMPGAFPDKKSATDALRSLSKQITKDGRFPAGSIPDPLRTDSVIVPFGSGGGAVYELKPNGTTILQTVLGPNEMPKP